MCSDGERCSCPSWQTVRVGTPEGFKTYCHSHEGFVEWRDREVFDRYGNKL